jgi:hypothetical protein
MITVKEFKKRSEKLFLKANPTATITGWTMRPKLVKFPTGVKGLLGEFHAVAVGHRPSIIQADYDEVYGLSVR